MPTRCAMLLVAAVLLALVPAARAQVADDRILPKHMTPQAQLAIKRGLDYLAKAQAPDGSYSNSRDGAYYPISMTSLAGMAFLANGNTPTRGPYAENVRDALAYVMQFSQSNGLITGPTQEQGRPMYGHGFSLMFMSCAYGMETRPKVRARLREIITAGIQLTEQGQSAAGGWTYTPGSGDEGSVTVTQIQALRAAHNAGFKVPESVIKQSIRYLELCRAPEGGIRYSLGSGGNSRLPISAAAVATLYNAGDYESDMADKCLEYVFAQFAQRQNSFDRGGGHAYYAHLYASQAFYQAGDEYWDKYFPTAMEQFLQQQQEDGNWDGDGVGPVYGTSIALVVLQLPYKFMPIYQR